MSNPRDTEPLVSILESFDKFPPQYLRLQDQQNPQASISGQSVLRQEPPAFAIKQDHEYWIRLSNEVLNDPNIQKILREEYISKRDPSTRHFNEADVVASIMPYLMYPVFRAMWAKYGDEFGRRLEMYHDHVKGDMTFGYGKLDKGIPHAVLEMKRRGVIRPHQFEDAQRWSLHDSENPNTTERQKQVETAKILKEAKENGKTSPSHETTLFEGNALKLVKQASAYAVKYGVQFVGLCDYDYLVLLRFPLLAKDDRGDYTIGSYCHVTIFDVRETPVRRALLGFLLVSLKCKIFV